MDGPNLEAHYQTWAQVWRHHNPGVEITDADLRLRYEEWAEAEESLLARERERWQRANWGYSPLRAPVEPAYPVKAEATRQDYLDRAEKRLRQRGFNPHPPTPKPISPVVKPSPAKPPSRAIPG